MAQKKLIVGAIISLVIIIITVALLITIRIKNKQHNNEAITNTTNEGNNVEIEDEPLIAVLERKNEEVEETPEYVKTPADITQDLQEMDINIGTLNIPKIGYVTDVYCKQDANKMEVMPCMLYTNQGPNRPGVTVFVGHNRENGTLFSNNKLLEENDELYFRDYEGTEKKYTVYSKFVTDSLDVSFYNTPSYVPILVMQCCLTATNSDQVIIIMAKAE